MLCPSLRMKKKKEKKSDYNRESYRDIFASQGNKTIR